MDDAAVKVIIVSPLMEKPTQRRADGKRLGAFVASGTAGAGRCAEAFFVAGAAVPGSEAAIEALRLPFRNELGRRLQARPLPAGLPETTPRTTADQRIEFAHAEVLEDCDGFLRRAAIEASLTRDERIEILRGMLLTRATDNRLKTLFTSGEVRYGQTPFQGKGFRSLGQEAIYAAGIRCAAVQHARGDKVNGTATSSRRSFEILA
jgi:hypothetical protein